MRMWMCDPALMCRKHLLGEHRELHALVGMHRLNKSFDGYLAKNLLELHNIGPRHTAIAAEMTRRGYNHQSPLTDPMIPPTGMVNAADSIDELYRRCDDCRSRIAATKLAP